VTAIASVIHHYLDCHGMLLRLRALEQLHKPEPRR
jgi:hypothetical protein